VQHYATTLATVCNCSSSSLKYGENTTHTQQHCKHDEFVLHVLMFMWLLKYG